ncbi:MAG: response regulator [Oscillochloris sp.]|nr:response regulator [Oscillochloris sp.]
MNEAPDSTPVAGNVARILVVDDEVNTCNFCALALNQAGYSAIPITDPELGLRTLIEQGPFDLLLTDIQMPGRSGIELAQIAREHDPALAVIIMTGYTNVDTLHQSARQGVANFLSKPVALEELQLAVGQALHKRDLLQEQVRLRALERLLASSEAINGTLDRETLCRVILEWVRTLIPSGAAFLHLNAVDRARAVLQADPPGAELSSIGQQRISQIDDIMRPVFIAQAVIATTEGRALNDGLLAPLRAGGMVLGALLVCDGSGINRPDAIDMIALLANQAGPPCATPICTAN